MTTVATSTTLSVLGTRLADARNGTTKADLDKMLRVSSVVASTVVPLSDRFGEIN